MLKKEIDKSCALYFVTTGIVEIYLKSCDTVISQLDVISTENEKFAYIF